MLLYNQPSESVLTYCPNSEYIVRGPSKMVESQVPDKFMFSSSTSFYNCSPKKENRKPGVMVHVCHTYKFHFENFLMDFVSSTIK